MIAIYLPHKLDSSKRGIYLVPDTEDVRELLESQRKEVGTASKYGKLAYGDSRVAKMWPASHSLTNLLAHYKPQVDSVVPCTAMFVAQLEW